MKIGNLEVYGVIYKITNKVNGKVYIGETYQKNGFKDRYGYSGNGIERVYKQHKGNKDNNRHYNEYLFNSIEKYGFEAFEVCEVFDVAFSFDELMIKEISWINIYKSNNTKYGYNIEGGGKDNKIINQSTRDKIRQKAIGRDMSDKTKDKISKALKGRVSPRKGSIMSEEQKQKISNTLKGKIISDETKIKISEARKGCKMSEETKKKLSEVKSKNVYCYNINKELVKIYQSIKETVKDGFSKTIVGKACNNKWKKEGNIYKGYIWSYEPLN